MKMNYKDMLKDGKGTDFIILDIAFNTKISDNYFLKIYFEKINHVKKTPQNGLRAQIIKRYLVFYIYYYFFLDLIYFLSPEKVAQ